MLHFQLLSRLRYYQRMQVASAAKMMFWKRFSSYLKNRILFLDFWKKTQIFLRLKKFYILKTLSHFYENQYSLFYLLKSALLSEFSHIMKTLFIPQMMQKKKKTISALIVKNKICPSRSDSQNTEITVSLEQ